MTIGEYLKKTFRASDANFIRSELSKLSKKIPDGMPNGEVYLQYLAGQHVLSMFAELKSPLQIMLQYYEGVYKAQEEYMPSFPPMSPLSSSYFAFWALTDFVFGQGKETIGTCFLDSIDNYGFPEEMNSSIKAMQSSRMGIYEHLGFSGKYIVLWELLTDRECRCFNVSGYQGTRGEIWLARLLPPILNADNYFSIITPYVLMEATPIEWVHFLNRMLAVSGDSKEQALYDFMKYGRSVNYWNEFIFCSYVNFKSDVIYLKGLPDIKSSLPHGRLLRDV